jgi:hypothetical protein
VFAVRRILGTRKIFGDQSGIFAAVANCYLNKDKPRVTHGAFLFDAKPCGVPERGLMSPPHFSSCRYWRSEKTTWGVYASLRRYAPRETTGLYFFGPARIFRNEKCQKASATFANAKRREGRRRGLRDLKEVATSFFYFMGAGKSCF